MSSSDHPADRLFAAIERVGAPVCVGLDPVVDRLPAPLRPAPDAGPDAIADAFRHFGAGVIDAVAAHVPVLKIQSACFERLGASGIAARDAVVADARARDLEVILDAKRGDIGVSARHYAAMQNATGAAWLTVSPYLGMETLAPYLENGGGAFALVRTSNPGSDAVQSMPLADGRRVAELIADQIAEAGRAWVGSSGYSALGAVVGATKPEDAAGLRTRMPQQIFLVPGYGAQGGGVADVLPCFAADGRGALVTSSRGVIYAFDPEDRDWTAAVRDAARRLADDIATALADVTSSRTPLRPCSRD